VTGPDRAASLRLSSEVCYGRRRVYVYSVGFSTRYRSEQVIRNDPRWISAIAPHQHQYHERMSTHDDHPTPTATHPAAGVSGVTAARTDTEINNYIGRGGWTRLYDVPIASGSAQINLAGALFRGFRINDWNNICEIPFTLTAAAGWSIQQAKYKLDQFHKRVAIRLMITRTGSTTETGDTVGNISDTDITTNWPTLLQPSEQAMAIIDRAVSDAGGTGVTFGRARITSKIELTSLLPGASFVSGAPCALMCEYDL
jgi:hypothetical protein